MSRIVSALISAAIACGSPETEPATLACDTHEPMQLLKFFTADFGEWGVSTTVAGDHVVANVSGIVASEPTTYAFASYAVDLCDGSALELEARNEQGGGGFGAAGPWALRVSSDRDDVSWIDPEGNAPSHVIFEAPGSCLLRIAGGLAVVDNSGTLWFHEDPADSAVEAVAVAHDVLVPGGSFYGDFSCTFFDAETPVVEGDALLIVERDGPLVRLSIPSGERETVIDATVAQIAVLDDPRYVLWLEGPRGDAECCNAWVRDRKTGDDLFVSREVVLGALDWKGRWVARHVRIPPDTLVVSTALLDVETGTTLSLDGRWDLEAQLAPGELLVRSSDDVAHISSTATGVLEAVDFPTPTLNEPRYADGVLGFAADASWWRGTLKLLRFEDGAIEDLAEVQSPYARLRDETIVFVDREDDDDETGALVFLRDGERRVIDSGVGYFMIPFFGTDRERPEVMYTVLDPPRAGLWRYVLP